MIKPKSRYMCIKQTSTLCTPCLSTNDKTEAQRWKRRWMKKFTAVVWDSKEKRPIII